MAYLEQEGCDTDAMWGSIKHIVDTSTNCFHILGFDIMFDQAAKGLLLEVNCSPSLAIDSVYPTTGPAAEEPVPCPDGVPHEGLMQAALEVMGRKATKLCK